METPYPSRLYLASQSPRRAELLQQIGVGFDVLSVEVDETMAASETAETCVLRLALEKARAGWFTLGPARQRPVLGADTIVIAADTAMGKPANRQQAIEMLMTLSGRTHQVITAVALAGEHEIVRSQCSRVTFRTLTRQECEAYWETGEPRDKAGAYAIQGLAAMFITRLEGSYSGVMGLPLYETAELLKTFGIDTLFDKS
ncbi:MAG: Maf family protein [Pseudomonadota bacterium]